MRLSEEHRFRLLLLRLSDSALISMLVHEADDRQAEIIRQELHARRAR